MSSHSAFVIAFDSSLAQCFIPGPPFPFCHGKYVVSICVSTVFQCDGAGWVVAAHRVVMDTPRFRLSCTRGSTLLVGTIPQAHLLLMSLTVYMEVCTNPTVHADSVSKSLCQNFFLMDVLAQVLMYISTGKVIKELVQAFSCARLSSGAQRKFVEHSRSWRCSWL